MLRVLPVEEPLELPDDEAAGRLEHGHLLPLVAPRRIAPRNSRLERDRMGRTISDPQSLHRHLYWLFFLFLPRQYLHEAERQYIVVHDGD